MSSESREIKLPHTNPNWKLPMQIYGPAEVLSLSQDGPSLGDGS